MAASIATRRQALAASVMVGGLARPALAAYPDRPIRWIVGYPPGGATDLVARLLGQSISTRIGQPVVIDNKPGAGSALGAEVLAKSAPDGYSVMNADNGTLIINPVVYHRLAYDPDRDFRPVSLCAGIHILLAVRADSPLRSASEYLARARAAAEPVPYASPGIGSPLHLAMERLARESGARLSHIPYRGMGPALNDVLAGSVGSIVIDYTTGAEMIRAGRIRALAVFSEARLANLPNVPTMAEQGLPGFAAGAWQGLIVPRATPDAAVERLSALLGEALAEPAVRARYEELGLDVPASDPATFARRWQADKAIWQPLIRSLGIKLDG